jgi:sulfatase modifying factor 1
MHTRICIFILAIISGVMELAAAPTTEMVVVREGKYAPPFLPKNAPKEVSIQAFQLDARPVTNAEFLEFVRANPRWRRSQVKRGFADEEYLSHWAGDLDLGADKAKVATQPVTRVSWFAARAYAAWRGARLPTTAEWEYAASAGFTRADGLNDAEFLQAVIHWYSTPTPETLPGVGSTRTNFYGIHDLHGVVWEWTSDFNLAMVTGSNGDTGKERDVFCGGGAVDAKDPGNFPAFMRFGFRSSLQSSYTVHNLGFRCAKDLSPGEATSQPE